LTNQSTGTNLTPVDYAAWKYVPLAYLRTADDRALPPFLQDICIDKARKADAIKMEETIQTGHSPFLNKPAETADFIKRFADSL
jgi:hypothetical protein